MTHIRLRNAAHRLAAPWLVLTLWLVSGAVHAQTATPVVTDESSAVAPLAADLYETVVSLPVTVQPLYGGARSGDMLLTHFRPPGNGPFPAVVMHHGRSSADRANPGRWRFLYIARYWQRRGFALFVPTRLGYGDTGLTPDPEETGPCDAKRYGPAAEATAVQTLATIEFARQQPWIDKDKVIVMGQSVGGLATVVAMGKAHPAVVAGINFAGGSGGDPAGRPGNPCSAFAIGRLYADAGKANAGRTPMLWLYAENDLYWGPDAPRKWHDAYVQAGGRAEMVMFPPIGSDGHLLIGTGLQLWRPVVDRFVASLGIRAPRSDGSPPPTGFAAVEDSSRVPVVRAEVRESAYKRFLNSDVPRAFAIGPKGEWAFQTGNDAIRRTLERCAQTAKTACKLYAVDDAVVWVE